MSLLPTCGVCDALLKGYGQNTRCDRCSQPCETCGGDVALCHHPLRDKWAVRVERELKRTIEIQSKRAA